MKLLSLDPSSSITGYAVFDGDDLVDAGKLLPTRQKDAPNDRIDAIVGELVKLLVECRPDQIVMEDTTGKVQRRHGGGGAGLAIYGKAVGEIRRAMIIAGVKVECINENEWTRGVVKARRQMWVAARYPKQYSVAKDSGGDVADAIGLGVWFIEREKYKLKTAG